MTNEQIRASHICPDCYHHALMHSDETHQAGHCHGRHIQGMGCGCTLTRAEVKDKIAQARQTARMRFSAVTPQQ